MDFRELYDRERYLLSTVSPRFHGNGYLNAFDSYYTLIWKANRSKSKLAKRLLLQSGCGDPDAAGRPEVERLPLLSS